MISMLEWWKIILHDLCKISTDNKPRTCQNKDKKGVRMWRTKWGRGEEGRRGRGEEEEENKRSGNAAACSKVGGSRARGKARRWREEGGEDGSRVGFYQTLPHCAEHTRDRTACTPVLWHWGLSTTVLDLEPGWNVGKWEKRKGRRGGNDRERMELVRDGC